MNFDIKELGAEFVGTFMLVSSVCGAALFSAPSVGLIAVALSSLFYVLATWGRRVVVHQAATDAGSVTVSEWQRLPPTVGRLGTLLFRRHITNK